MKDLLISLGETLNLWGETKRPAPRKAAKRPAAAAPKRGGKAKPKVRAQSTARPKSKAGPKRKAPKRAAPARRKAAPKRGKRR